METLTQKRISNLKPERKKPSQGCIGLQQEKKQKVEEDDLFYSWQCVSLLRQDRTTFDIVVKDMHHLMCFLHVMHRLIYEVEIPEEDQRVKAGRSTSYMSVYKMLKFKMKVSY